MSRLLSSSPAAAVLGGFAGPFNAVGMPDDLRGSRNMQPDPKPARAEAVRFALRDWFTGLGLLPFYDDPEMAN